MSSLGLRLGQQWRRCCTQHGDTQTTVRKISEDLRRNPRDFKSTLGTKVLKI